MKGNLKFDMMDCRKHVLRLMVVKSGQAVSVDFTFVSTLLQSLV